MSLVGDGSEVFWFKGTDAHGISFDMSVLMKTRREIKHTALNHRAVLRESRPGSTVNLLIYLNLKDFLST